jgi:von Willebrand factor type A domain
MRIWLATLALGVTACTAGVGMRGGLMLPVSPAPYAAQGGMHASVEVRVSFFGVPLDNAQDVVFVLDRSGSMSGVATGFSGQAVGMSRTQSLVAGLGADIANAVAGDPLASKLDAAKAELVRTIRAMPDGTRFNIIFFDDEINALSRSMMTLHPGTRAGVEAFISGIEPGGSTAAVPALELAYEIRAARIILLSDGLANTGGGADALLERARAQIGMGVRFDTVGIGLDQDLELMQKLAGESGGVALMR